MIWFCLSCNNTSSKPNSNMSSLLCLEGTRDFQWYSVMFLFSVSATYCYCKVDPFEKMSEIGHFQLEIPFHPEVWYEWHHIWPNLKNRCVENLHNYWWGKHLLYCLKDGICMIAFPTPYSKSPNLSQYDTSNVFNEIPKHDNKQHISIKTDTLSHNEI